MVGSCGSGSGNGSGSGSGSKSSSGNGSDCSSGSAGGADCYKQFEREEGFKCCICMNEGLRGVCKGCWMVCFRHMNQSCDRDVEEKSLKASLQSATDMENEANHVDEEKQGLEAEYAVMQKANEQLASSASAMSAFQNDSAAQINDLVQRSAGLIAEKKALIDELSLIHISEPTRPRLI
eukprot:2289156-Rhodomonas_salina.1